MQQNIFMILIVYCYHFKTYKYTGVNTRINDEMQISYLDKETGYCQK